MTQNARERRLLLDRAAQLDRAGKLNGRLSTS
jgi:hypothetical protein